MGKRSNAGIMASFGVVMFCGALAIPAIFMSPEPPGASTQSQGATAHPVEVLPSGVVNTGDVDPDHGVYGSSATIAEPELPAVPASHADVVGGNLEWTPERSDSPTTPPCVDRKLVGSAYADLTASVKDDVTYVDLQAPQNLRGLTGLQVGADYVPVPDFLFQAHVSTILLGNQFPNRSEIYSCWG